MLIYIANIFRSLFLFFTVSRNMKRQKRFVEKHLTSMVQKTKLSNDGSLDNEDYRKIQIYATTIPAMLGETFCELRGWQMSDKERLSVTYLASITGLFDDLFDRERLLPDEIKRLLNQPDKANASNNNELLLIELCQAGLANSDKPDLIKEYALKVYEAQLQSKKQSGGELSKEDIRQITFEKGGVSIPLYRCAFEGDISQAEYDMLYHLGSIGQLENDIFDVHKDYSEGIQTLVTTETDISKLREKYQLLITDIFQLIDKTQYQVPQKRRFKRVVALVVGRGLVGLDNLQNLSRKTEGVFLLEKYSRKELICDMESPLNLLKLLHYAAIYTKK